MESCVCSTKARWDLFRKFELEATQKDCLEDTALGLKQNWGCFQVEAMGRCQQGGEDQVRKWRARAHKLKGCKMYQSFG